MGAGRRRRAIRNLYSYLNRRKKIRDGGYPKKVICPSCSRAIVTDGKNCKDCNQ